ncbi:MAG: TonB-dependent receptor [Bacteroidales bacterium]|nr:TonB-dependent receptor [Bacteroidales bacterium]
MAKCVLPGHSQEMTPRPYMTREGYNLFTTGWNGLSYASKNSTLPVDNLKNELTESIEFGADLRFLQNRISLDLTYYDGKTSNQILELGPDGQKIVDGSGSYVRESKLSVLGNITPKWIGGLNNTFSYKGFALNVLLDFKEGGKIISATKYEMTRKGLGAWTVEGRRPKARYEEGDVIPTGSTIGDPMPYTGVLDGVVEIKDASGNVTGYEKNTKAVPGMIYWGNRAWNGIAEEFVEDGSYISLREAMLSYTFQPALLAKTPISGLTISVFGRNLLYLQNGMDYIGVSPESAPNTAGGASGMESLTIPSTRTYGFNVRITF